MYNKESGLNNVCPKLNLYSDIDTRQKEIRTITIFSQIEIH
jgi:hypothetical protein